MERTTISLPEDLHKRLRLLAAERNMSMAEIIRQVLEEKVAEQRPRPKSIGIGASLYTDTARRTAGGLPETPEWR